MVNGRLVIAHGADQVVELVGQDVKGLAPGFDARFTRESLGVAAKAGGKAFGGQDDTAVCPDLAKRKAARI